MEAILHSYIKTILESSSDSSSSEGESDNECERNELLVHLLSRRRVSRPYHSHLTTQNGANRLINMVRMRSKFGDDAVTLLRFSCDQIESLINHLRIPQEFNFSGYKCTGVEAFIVSLYRLSTKTRFADMCFTFDLLPSFLSQIFAGFTVWMYETFNEYVTSFHHVWTTERDWLEYFSAKVQENGCPLPNCIGFLDGTHVKVCRPVRDQRTFYCGHHKTHCFKCLIVVFPNGIVVAFGPYNGSMHDSSQTREAELEELLEKYLRYPDKDFFIFGDSGFPIQQHLITPFRRTRQHSPEENEWNQQMSSQRISVEWSIGRIKSLFPMLENKKNLKLLQSPVAMYWFNAIFLSNIHSCINGHCQVSDYFGVPPPTVQQYLFRSSN